MPHDELIANVYLDSSFVPDRTISNRMIASILSRLGEFVALSWKYPG